MMRSETSVTDWLISRCVVPLSANRVFRRFSADFLIMLEVRSFNMNIT